MAELKIEINGDYEPSNRLLSATVQSTLLSQSDRDLYLCLWLCESGIVAPQLMPDDTRDSVYVHNNVFRASLNSAFGQQIASGGAAGEQIDTPFSYFVPAAYTAENCKLVVFVYDNATQEVLQVEEVSLDSL